MRKSMLPVAVLAITFFAVPAFGATVILTSTLSGANEPAGGDADGTGGFRVEIDASSGDFCYTLWGDKIAVPTMAHVHSGGAGVDGPPVVTIAVTGKDSDQCVAIGPDKLKPMLADPAAFYVNIHTADFPKGAVRGQLAKP